MAKGKLRFDHAGFPLRGRHRLTLREFQQQFVDAMPTPRRKELWRKFEAMAKEAFASGIIVRILIGGSFASKKDEPNDVDFVLVLRQDVEIETLPLHQRVWTNRRDFGRHFDLWALDMFAAREGTPECERLIAQFKRTRPPYRKRGIIEVIPDDGDGR